MHVLDNLYTVLEKIGQATYRRNQSPTLKMILLVTSGAKRTEETLYPLHPDKGNLNHICILQGVWEQLFGRPDL